jgi:hypothetical protein
MIGRREFITLLAGAAAWPLAAHALAGKGTKLAGGAFVLASLAAPADC